MNSLIALLTPIVLLVPAIAADMGGKFGGDEARAAAESEAQPIGLDTRAVEGLRVLEDARRPPSQNQVRIEQRVIIRIGPSSSRAFQQSMAARTRAAQEFREEQIDNCVAIDSIAAVQPLESNRSRLLLFMRDRRILSAALERACNSEDFYSGAYVENSADGKLCTSRDRLQSRTGANCHVTRISRLVAESE